MLLVLFSAPVFAQGNKPKDEPPKKESSLKDDANQALDDFSTGLRKVGSSAKKTANDALNEVDRGVHKVVGPSESKKKK
jgi:hypothetical protein